MAFELIVPEVVLEAAGVKSLDDFLFRKEVVLKKDLSKPLEYMYTPEHRSSIRNEIGDPLFKFYWYREINSDIIEPILDEIVTNAIYHGPEDETDVFLGVYARKFLKLIACNDRGDYFKRLEIKQMWENQSIVSEYHFIADRKGMPHGGQKRIYGNGRNVIHVDNSQGTLYVFVPANEEVFFKRKTISLNDLGDKLDKVDTLFF